MRKSDFLQIRLYWLIQLRWIVFLILSLLATLQHFQLLRFFIGGIVTIKSVIFILGGANLFFYLIYLFFHNKYDSLSKIRVYFFFAQVFVDYLCVTMLIDKYGMIPINLAVLYLPHVIITSIVFEKFRPGLLVMLASLIIIFIMTLQQSRLIDEAFTSYLELGFNLSGSLALLLFNISLFVFIFYLVSLLVKFIAQNKRELLEKNQQLMNLDAEKQKYTLRATHELKAPFSAIQSYIGVILEGHVGEINPKVREIMGKIDLRCSSLTKMIQNIIQLSNLKTSVFKEGEFVNTEVIKVLRSKIEQHSSYATSKQIRIELEVKSEGEGALSIKVIPNLFEILFDNLIINAIHYSKENSKIRVVISRGKIVSSGPHLEREAMVYEVIDQGIGIAAKNIDKIFNEHFRCNDAAAINPSGNGMGLPIVKEIVRLHFGEIKVESEVGVGSRFIVTLPTDIR